MARATLKLTFCRSACLAGRPEGRRSLLRHDGVAVGPGIEVAADELEALVDLDNLGIAPLYPGYTDVRGTVIELLMARTFVSNVFVKTYLVFQ